MINTGCRDQCFIILRETIENHKYKCMTIFGVMNPIDIGKNEIRKISDELIRFGEFMDRL